MRSQILGVANTRRAFGEARENCRAQNRRGIRQIVRISSLAAVFAVWACGSRSGSDQLGQVKTVSRAFLVAFSTGDPTACDRLTAAGRRAFVDDTGVTCRRAVKDCCVPSKGRELLEAKNVAFRVKINGDSATATYDRPSKGLPNTLTLVKTGGGWLIDDAIYPRRTDPAELR